MPAGSGVLQAGTLSGCTSGSMLVAGVTFNISKTTTAPASFTNLANLTGSTADSARANRLLSSSGSFSSVFGWSGGIPTSWKGAGIMIELKAASTFTPKTSSSFLVF